MYYLETKDPSWKETGKPTDKFAQPNDMKSYILLSKSKSADIWEFSKIFSEKLLKKLSKNLWGVYKRLFQFQFFNFEEFGEV